MSARRAPDELARALEAGTVDAASFGHVEHLAAAFAMLHNDDFTQTASRYCASIRHLAARAGAADKFNTTVTIAYLALLAECIARAPGADFDALLAANPQLLDRRLLHRWYSPGQLQGDLAREIFLLPRALPAAEAMGD